MRPPKRQILPGRRTLAPDSLHAQMTVPCDHRSNTRKKEVRAQRGGFPLLREESPRQENEFVAYPSPASDSLYFPAVLRTSASQHQLPGYPAHPTLGVLPELRLGSPSSVTQEEDGICQSSMSFSFWGTISVVVFVTHGSLPRTSVANRYSSSLSRV